MNFVQSIKPAPQVLAWRISFSKDAVASDNSVAIVTEPGRVWAHKTSLEIEYALQQSTSSPGEFLDLVWIEQGADVPWDPEKRVEEWLAADTHSPRRIIRAGLRTIQIIWSPGRAVVFAPAEHLSDAQDAIIRFTSVAWQTQALEQDMREVWPILESHIPLLHSVTRKQLKLQGEVDAMTERTNRMSLALTKLDEPLEQLSPSLTPTSKRLFDELCLQGAIEERLEAIEDPIDNAVEHYEMANDRLIEARNASSGRFMETLIVMVLLLELSFNVAERVNWRDLVANGVAAFQAAQEFKVTENGS